MIELTQALHKVNALLHDGGLPLLAILCLATVIFVLFFERLGYMYLAFPRIRLKLETHWEKQQDLFPDWQAQNIRTCLVATCNEGLQKFLWIFRTAIVVCPLLGLIGTVSGMIIVFDQLYFSGTSNPRLMSSGIFKATLPTMAGMLVSIIGMMMQKVLQRSGQRKYEELNLTLRPCSLETASSKEAGVA